MRHDTVIHRAIRPAVRALARTGVAPDHLTALRLAAGLAAGAAFAGGSPGWLRAGAAIFVFSALLDRADGELARQTRRFSRHGHRWDLAADCAAGAVAFAGLGLGARGGPLGPAAPVLGGLAALGVATLFWQINARDAGALPGVAAGGRVLFDPDDGMFTVPVLIWLFGPEAVLLPAGAVTPALALWKTLQARTGRRARRRARPR